MTKYAIIAASLALAMTAGVADSKSTTRASACPSVSILGDATRVTVLDQGKIGQ